MAWKHLAHHNAGEPVEKLGYPFIASTLNGTTRISFKDFPQLEVAFPAEKDPYSEIEGVFVSTSLLDYRVFVEPVIKAELTRRAKKLQQIPPPQRHLLDHGTMFDICHISRQDALRIQIFNLISSMERTDQNWTSWWTHLIQWAQFKQRADLEVSDEGEDFEGELLHYGLADFTKYFSLDDLYDLVWHFPDLEAITDVRIKTP